MFSRDIVQSDAFLDMPTSTQALYFHLGMEADDDGFIGNPRKVQRILGSSDDDMKILIGKKFVIIFESGVLVIKHHRMNNNWDSHNSRRTVYLEELSQLHIKENRAYTLDKSKGNPVQSETRLITDGKQSLEEKRIEEKKGAAKASPTSSEVREVQLTTEGDEKQPRQQRVMNRPALALREKLYDMLEKDNGIRPTTHMGDYARVTEALKTLTEKQVLEMFEEAVSRKTIHTVREVFTARNIDIYRQEL